MANSTKIKLIAVVGATASGKTSLAVELARAIDGEVVSCDSMQIYRGMDIATAAPTPEEMLGVPHHMIRIAEPTDSYSVVDYCKQAGRCIEDIAARGKQPILCGGTGLYFSSLTEGINFIEQEGSETLRRELYEQYSALGGEVMLKRLNEIDPETAQRLNVNDAKRVLRALEVYELTGIPQSEHIRRSRLGGSPYKLLTICIDYHDRQKLYDRINNRVDIMLDKGIIEEAKRFYERYGSGGGTAVQAIGYKELKPFIDGECELADAVERLKRETRRYAKRQLSWFRRNENIVRIFADDENGASPVEQAIRLAKEFTDGR